MGGVAEREICHKQLAALDQTDEFYKVGFRLSHGHLFLKVFKQIFGTNDNVI